MYALLFFPGHYKRYNQTFVYNNAYDSILIIILNQDLHLASFYQIKNKK